MFRNGGDETERFKASLEEMIKSSKQQSAVAAGSRAAGGLIGFALSTFFVPFLAVYAWNAMTPEVWIDWQYWPTVAAMSVFRIIVTWVKA